jgi:hypothetical protein
LLNFKTLPTHIRTTKTSLTRSRSPNQMVL